MQHEHPEIAYLSITPATKEYAKQHGARHNKVHGWHIFGLVPVELEEFIVSAPRERAHNNIVYCPNCGGQMRLINSRTGNIFWGCMLYPKCTGTRATEKTKVFGEAETILDSYIPKDQPSKRQTERVSLVAHADLEKLAQVAIKQLGTSKRVESWFNTPKVSLGGKRPVDVMRSPDGFNLLVELLQQINE